MPTVHAIFENGVFRPTEPVDLDEATEVVFEPRLVKRKLSQSADISKSIAQRPLSESEIRQWLDELAACSSGASFPSDWSRADLYDEDEPR